MQAARTCVYIEYTIRLLLYELKGKRSAVRLVRVCHMKFEQLLPQRIRLFLLFRDRIKYLIQLKVA
jgi:hypothetical protein